MPNEEFEAAVARMAPEALRQKSDAVDAAARSVELPSLTTIPTPDYRPGCVVRYWCPLGCGWWHDERPALEPTPPLILPAGFTSADIDRAITEQAAARGRAYAARVEQAIADHFGAAHPDR